VKSAVTLPGLQKISPPAVFCTGLLLGMAFAFYRDSLKVRMLVIIDCLSWRGLNRCWLS